MDDDGRAERTGRATKAGKGKVEAEGESSSRGGSEAQVTEGVAGEELTVDDLAGLDALAGVATKLQEEEEIGEVVEIYEEWLAAGPQAPEPVLDQRTRRRATNRGAVASNPAPTAKRVKKTTTKITSTDVACRQSPRLAGIKASPAKQSADVQVHSSSHSGSSSSQSSSSSEPPAPKQGLEPPESSAPLSQKRGRGPRHPWCLN